jgi:putative membrane protein
MLWIKALHIVFVTSWFAGLFYLPRIFVNLAMETDATANARLLLMARKLYRFTTILAVPAVVLGVALLVWMFGAHWPGWMHAKFALVVLTLGYHHACGAMLKKFEQGKNQRSHVWLRWFNEVPVILLFGIVVLVVVKPF